MKEPVKTTRKQTHQKVPNEEKKVKATVGGSSPAANKKVKGPKRTNKVATKTKKKKMSIWVKDIFLAIINLAFIGGLIYILSHLSGRANQIKVIRNGFLAKTQGSEVEIQEFDLEISRESTEKLAILFPTEDGLLEFVDEVEKLKSSGVVVKFTFESRDPIADKTRYLGLPITIEMAGSWSDIDKDIQKIQSLPYMFRPVTFDAQEDSLDQVVRVKYGGFLYVDESLEKN